MLGLVDDVCDMCVLVCDVCVFDSVNVFVFEGAEGGSKFKIYHRVSSF